MMEESAECKWHDFWCCCLDGVYTEHGQKHSRRVFDNIMMLYNKLRRWNIFPRQQLRLGQVDWRNVTKLLASLHDIGMLGGRENHNKRSHQIINYYPSILGRLYPRLSPTDIDLLGRIIEAHSGNFYGLTQGLTSPQIFLAILLRLADELDITQKRVSREAFEIFAKFCGKFDILSRLHWKSHLIISGKINIRVDANKLCIYLQIDPNEWKSSSFLEVLFTIYKLIKLYREMRLFINVMGNLNYRNKSTLLIVRIGNITIRFQE